MDGKFLYSFANREVFLKCLPKFSSILELGVFQGENAFFMLENLLPRQLQLVDTWYLSKFEDLLDSSKSPYNNLSKDVHAAWDQDTVNDFRIQLSNLVPIIKSGDSEEMMNQIFLNCQKRFYGDSRVKIFRTDGLSHAKLLTDGSLDIAYIDANHSYQACLQDLRSYAPKVSPKGYIAGNDYTKSNKKEHKHYGVIEAVTQFIRESDFKLVAISHSDYADFILTRKGNTEGIVNIIKYFSEIPSIYLPIELASSYFLNYEADNGNNFIPTFG